jgi:hypothetical protein
VPLLAIHVAKGDEDDAVSEEAIDQRYRHDASGAVDSVTGPMRHESLVGVPLNTISVCAAVPHLNDAVVL